MSFNICRGTLGSLAMFTAMPRRDSRPNLSAFVSVIGAIADARTSNRRGS
jgi:hypothetical protein